MNIHYEVYIPDKFAKKFYPKLSTHKQKATDKSINLLMVNPRHPSLDFKPIRGTRDCYEVSVNGGHRMTMKKNGKILYLRKVGPHDILKNP